MTMPVWSLLGFSLWTVLLLFCTVGWYRWSRILTGREAISSFSADNPQGSDAYRRAMRAHANCVENLPVFAGIVIAVLASGARGAALDVLSIVVLLARIAQTLVHVALVQNDRATSVRFAFFFTQIACMIAMSVLVVRHALA